MKLLADFLFNKCCPAAVGHVHDAFPQWMKEKITLTIKNLCIGTSLVVQCLRLRLPIHGVHVRALVMELLLLLLSRFSHVRLSATP